MYNVIQKQVTMTEYDIDLLQLIRPTVVTLCSSTRC